ncbi:hypothetical protein D3C81_1407660 [compost metagenome]
MLQQEQTGQPAQQGGQRRAQQRQQRRGVRWQPQQRSDGRDGADNAKQQTLAQCPRQDAPVERAQAPQAVVVQPAAQHVAEHHGPGHGHEAERRRGQQQRHFDDAGAGIEPHLHMQLARRHEQVAGHAEHAIDGRGQAHDAYQGHTA